MLAVLLGGILRANVPSRLYATVAVPTIGKKKKLGKMGAVVEKKVLPVETDANKLVNFVCGSNFNKEGEDVPIKADSEYPDWLWTLNTGKAPTLDEMDPETKEYWYKVKKLAIIRQHKMKKIKKF